MKLLFMGTPIFSKTSLEHLWLEGYQICGVFTRPDKPQNRGMKLTRSPVKEFAVSHDLPVFTPSILLDAKTIQTIAALKPDLIVVVAYGKILPAEILNLPPCGCINVHASLLPKYRGAAPIQWAILNGEAETGVTIMRMAPELDAGDMISTASTPIGPDETSEELHDRLMTMGASLLSETIPSILDGSAARIPQDIEKATYAPMLDRSLSPMDFSRGALALHNQVRGLLPWPSATAVFGGRRFKILRAVPALERTGQRPGTIIRGDDHGLFVACGNGEVLLITRLQAEGGKKMNASDYLRGHKLELSQQ
ncbi:MAG: methionyl-tRNA formyltransferase [Oscillospiraceae bacterium]|nr:methionyl-tRNA formyltransferase [Oscillospiraceae bacterium]